MGWLIAALMMQGFTLGWVARGYMEKRRWEDVQVRVKRMAALTDFLKKKLGVGS